MSSLFYSFFFKLLFYIGVQPINNVVMVSGQQQRDSATHEHESIVQQTGSKLGNKYVKAV